MTIPPPPKGFDNWLEVYIRATGNGHPDASRSFVFPKWDEKQQMEEYYFKEICMYAMAYVVENLPTGEEVLGMKSSLSGLRVPVDKTMSKLYKIAKK